MEYLENGKINFYDLVSKGRSIKTKLKEALNLKTIKVKIYKIGPHK